MPSDRIVFTVRASFAIQQTAENDATDAVEVLFDSAAQALPPGARASVLCGRQLLYRIGSVYVDLKIDKDTDSERAVLVGQMLDSARPGHALTGIPVAVREQGRRIAQTMSNDNGEFCLEFELKNDQEILLLVNRRHPVHLPITNAEQRSVTAPAGKSRKTGVGIELVR
jgi:hypothetical protein